MSPLPPGILITSAEAKLFQLLNEVSSKTIPPVVCRVAGGWVRDKLLGQNTHDLDIALDSMMGIQFAKSLSHFLKVPGNASRYIPSSDSKKDVGAKVLMTHIGKIKANPLKSKHLETAACHLMGFSLDFVNLRSESYNEHSRIPEEIKFGTPMEDALRRDCTINALFYNISTEQVEDFTGKGLKDLSDKVIRTPLLPKETFQDDPLRVLRAIRFASRFNFNLDKDLKLSAKDRHILASLATKISKERVGEEVTKMLTGPSPNYAISLLSELEVLPILCLSADASPIHVGKDVDGLFETVLSERFDFKLVSKAFSLLHWLTSQKNTRFPEFRSISFPKPATYFSILAFPFLKHDYTAVEITEHLKSCFKLRNKETDFMLAVCNNARTVVDDGCPSASISPSYFPEHRRVQLGLCVRSLGKRPICEQYVTLLLLNLVFELLTKVEEFQSTENVNQLSEIMSTGVSKTATDILQKYHQLLLDIQSNGVADAWNLKPLINGNVLCERMKIPPGPKIKVLTEAMVEWQLAHPSSNDSEACLEWLSSCLGSSFDPISHSEPHLLKQKRNSH